SAAATTASAGAASASAATGRNGCRHRRRSRGAGGRCRSRRVCRRPRRANKSSSTADRVVRPHRSEEHTSELQSPDHLVCRLLLSPPTPALSPLSLPDALPISPPPPPPPPPELPPPPPPPDETGAGTGVGAGVRGVGVGAGACAVVPAELTKAVRPPIASYARTDRKSTRLNSSHQIISYAVFCFLLPPPHSPPFPYPTLFRSLRRRHHRLRRSCLRLRRHRTKRVPAQASEPGCGGSVSEPARVPSSPPS